MPWTIRCPSYRQPQLPILSTLLNSIDTADLINAAEFPTILLCHPSTVSSSLGQSSPKSQLSSAYCCASCCVLPHTHSADFRYCHASCHRVATIQQCFPSAYTLTDFNPVTNLPHQKEVDVLVEPSLKHLCPKSTPIFTVQDCPHTTSRLCPYFHPECRPPILWCQVDILFANSCQNPSCDQVFSRFQFVSHRLNQTSSPTQSLRDQCP
jgi:hypothetical protein